MVRRDKFPYTNNIKLTQLYPTSQMLEEIITFGCSPNKAIVGANAFAHESGIHQHGVLSKSSDLRETHDAGVRRRLTPTSSSANTSVVSAPLRDRFEKLGQHAHSPEQLSMRSTTASQSLPTERNPSTTRTSSAC